MSLWRRKMRVAAVAGVGVVALIAAGCSSNGSGTTGSSGSTGAAKVKGGTATVALPAGVTYSWIFPFYAITNSSVYNDQQFQWLMYRPLYMFGNNTNTSVSVNYPLSPANPPVYSNGGKTVVVDMKGWKWSNGETVDANCLIFFLNMTKAEKANWYAYASGLLPDNVVSYKATGPDQVTIPAQQGVLQPLVHLQPAGRAQPDAAGLGRDQPRPASRAAAAAPPTARPTAGPSARRSTRS